MREFENVPESISGNPPKRNDPYTYYAGQPAMPSLPRYVPEYKKKKKKQPWVSVLVTGLLCSILGGTAYDAALIGYDESNDIAVLKGMLKISARLFWVTQIV